MVTILKIGKFQETKHLKEVRARDKTIVTDALKMTAVLTTDPEGFVKTTLAAFLDRRFLLAGIDTASIIISTLGELLATSRALLELRIAEKKEIRDEEKAHLEHIIIVTNALMKDEED